MANKKPINKDNPKNIYCGHCKHFKDSERKDVFGQTRMICYNKKSKQYLCKRYYYHRCKAFEWEDKEDGK